MPHMAPLPHDCYQCKKLPAGEMCPSHVDAAATSAALIDSESDIAHISAPPAKRGGVGGAPTASDGPTDATFKCVQCGSMVAVTDRDPTDATVFGRCQACNDDVWREVGDVDFDFASVMPPAAPAGSRFENPSSASMALAAMRRACGGGD